MPSFDIVCGVDLQEVRNAVDQANREARTRFDFKDTDSKIEWEGRDTLILESASESRLKALLELLEEKLVRRKVSLKALRAEEPRPAAKGRFSQRVGFQLKLTPDQIRTISNEIKSLGLKRVSVQKAEDGLRVQSKSKDELQAVIKALKARDLGVPLSFVNMRD